MSAKPSITRWRHGLLAIGVCKSNPTTIIYWVETEFSCTNTSKRDGFPSASYNDFRGALDVGGGDLRRWKPWRCAADSTRRPISETDPTILGQMTKCDQKGELTRAICMQRKTSSVLMRAPQFRITAQCCIDKVAASFASVLVDSSINLSRSGEPPLSSRSLIAHSRRIIAAWSSSRICWGVFMVLP